ncbi:MAG: hypothetical protein IKN15_05860 [Bacteroidaceae bacterium]|nr:hypothetical protein [Bacteroidaceae bacterium]
MATTKEKIEQALTILKYHDFMWMMSDSNNAKASAKGNMRAFVKLVASIQDKTIVKALRELWIANYEYVNATFMIQNEDAKAKFKAKQAELMAIILPTHAMAA